MEKELVDTFQKLYEKNVPAPVRAFIEHDNERTKSTTSKSKKKDNPNVNEFTQEQKQQYFSVSHLLGGVCRVFLL